MPNPDNDNLSSREIELLIETGSVAAVESRIADHRIEHRQEGGALDKALTAEKVLRNAHDVAHTAAHDAHGEKHEAEGLAVKTALAAVDRERKIHAEAHEREHEGHQREHMLANLAIEKAESATDKRFASTNAYREQISDMIRNLARRESLESLEKEVDRRFEEQRKDTERRHEEMRQALTTLEKTDVKAEGKGIGQAAIIAYIVAGLSVVGSLVVVVNVLTGTP